MNFSTKSLKRALLALLIAALAVSLPGCIVVPRDHDEGWQHHGDHWDHDRGYHRD